MKIAALLFFVQNLPLVLVIITLLYGGFSTTVLKEELAKNNMYEKVISFTKDSSTEQGETDPLFTVLQNYLTAEYLQTKTEGVIDDATLWVTGKTETPPVLSMKEIKDDIEITNPTLLTDLQQMSQEMQTAAAAESGEASGANPSNELETFIKNDFSFPLKDTFIVIKYGYIGLTIALPVLITLLILSLVVLGVVNKTWHKRFRWFGITFLLAGALGVLTIFLNKGLAITVRNFLLGQEDQLVQMIAPIIERSLLLFVNQHAIYQTITNYILFSVGTICLILSFVIKEPSTPVPTKPAKSPAKKSR